jgi:hypothetical protein
MLDSKPIRQGWQNPTLDPHGLMKNGQGIIQKSQKSSDRHRKMWLKKSLNCQWIQW